MYDLLDSWRTGIASMETEDLTEFLAAPWYDTLRPYMSDSKRKALEKPRTFHDPAENGRGVKDPIHRRG